MNNFAFYSPTEFVFGKGTESQTAELVKKYKGTKVMIVYGGGSVVHSGLLDKVKKYLDEAGIAHVELGGIQPNPTDPKVYEGIELGRREGIDFLLPVGGGSVIDTAKAIAMALAVSMTEPPPTGSRKSIPSRRPSSIPSYTFGSVGLGWIPPSST